MLMLMPPGFNQFSFAMSKAQIILPIRLTPTHLAVVLQYFEAANQLGAKDWQLALAAFDMLGNATLVSEGKPKTFRQYYESTVERRYAETFLTALLDADVPATIGPALQQQIATEMLAQLEQDGLYHEDIADSEYLAAYCMYWWTSFARGYRFEIAILRELETAGIAFAAHNLLVRAERLAPYDLVVNRWLGDIKHTTYFLFAARSFPLRCDFYLTQLYDTNQRRYQPIVLLTEAAWHDLNGPVIAASLATAAVLFPEPVQIVFENQTFIVVTFERWKEHVRRRQQPEIAL